jgi:hypothetical protein
MSNISVIASYGQEQIIDNIIFGDLYSNFIKGAYFLYETGPGTLEVPTTPFIGSVYATLFTSGNGALIQGYDGNDTTYPNLGAFHWSKLLPGISGRGFGTQYSNPASPPPGVVLSLSTNNDKSVIVAGHLVTPFISAYKWDNATGWGTRYSNPAVIPADSSVQETAFSPDGTVLAVVYGTTGLAVYHWDNTTGFGSTYTLPVGMHLVQSVAFNSTGTAIAVAINTSPHVRVFHWNNTTGFGTEYASPASYGTPTVSNAHRVKFSPGGTAILLGNGINAGPGNGLIVYRWSDSTGFGSVLSDGTIGLNIRCISFNANGSVVSYADDYRNVAIYKWTEQFGLGTMYLVGPYNALTVGFSNG